MKVKGCITMASGLVCTSLALKSSDVPQGMEPDPALTQGAMVLTLGKDNTEEGVNRFL